jgi:uncharacterized membrane protein
MRNVAIMLALLMGVFGIACAVGLSAGEAGRMAFAAIFIFTALGHFAKTSEMVEMLPVWVPSRRLVVIASGVFELALAAAILVPASFRLAAAASIAFLALVTPLNVYSAVRGVKFGGHGDGPTYLLIRIPLQVLLITWIWWFCFHEA